MYEKFGEFDSVEELNAKAAELKDKEDEEALVALALENGIEREDAEDYMDDVSTEFATSLMAAIGKLKVEKEDTGINGILEDWYLLIVEACTNDEKMQVAVRRKSKKLNECMAKLIAFAFENKVQISDKIVNVCKVKHNGKTEAMRKPLYLGIPNKMQVKQIIAEYYLG